MVMTKIFVHSHNREHVHTEVWLSISLAGVSILPGSINHDWLGYAGVATKFHQLKTSNVYFSLVLYVHAQPSL